VKRRSFHRPRWTGVTRTRRPANSLRVKPRSWQRRRARQSSSTESAGYLRCDRRRGRPFPRRAPAVPPFRRIGMHGGEGGPGRRGAALAQKPAGLRRGATTSSPASEAPRRPRQDAPGGSGARSNPGGMSPRRYRRPVPSRRAGTCNNATRSAVAPRVVAPVRLPPT
jgi:hypothetical protein